MRKLSNQPSHLGVESQQSRHKEWKADCEFCYTKYNKDLSDALDPEKWCSLECQVIDENESQAYIEHKRAKPL